MSSLDTLLEAARYVEMQELQQKQMQQIHQQQQQQLQKAAVEIPPTINSPQPAITRSLQSPHPPLTAAPPASTAPPLRIKQEAPPITHQTQARVIHNSFDIINPLVIDEGGEHKRKQPPLVFRAGTREVHNKLEKHRRAHLKECFDLLKKQLPAQAEEKKTSNLSILHSALRYIQTLKRKERDLEHEMERLAREKISAQQRLAVLKKEIVAQCDNVDFSTLLVEHPPVSTITTVTESKMQESNQNIAVNPTSNDKMLIPSITKPQITTVTASINGVKESLTVSSSPLQTLHPLPPPTSHSQQQQPPQLTPVVSQPQPQQQQPQQTQQQQQQQPQTTQQPQQQPMQTTALSVLPVAGYPQGLVLHKVALVPKGIADLTPLAAVSSPVAHFITTPQQLNGKVLPVVNAQYVVKPVVVVSSPPSVTPRSS